MDFKLDIDLSLLDARAKGFEQNLAFSVAQALNDTAKVVQAKIRSNVKARFKLRKSDFVLRLIKISTFANARQNRPYAVIEVDQSKGRVLLGKFEEGGQKEPWVGHHVAVPITGSLARPSFDQSVNVRQVGFKALNFQQKTYGQLGRDSWKNRKRATKPRPPKAPRPGAGKSIWVGRNGAFILSQTARAPLGGVFYRAFSTKRGDIKMLYSFRGAVRLKRALGFIETAKATYQADFQEEFYRRFLHIQKS